MEEKIKHYTTTDSIIELLNIRKSNQYISSVKEPISPKNEFNKTDRITPIYLPISDKHLKLYHKLDLSFNTPKVCFYLQFITITTRAQNEMNKYLNLYHYHMIKGIIEEKLNDAIDAGNDI